MLHLRELSSLLTAWKWEGGRGHAQSRLEIKFSLCIQQTVLLSYPFFFLVASVPQATSPLKNETKMLIFQIFGLTDFVPRAEQKKSLPPRLVAGGTED